MKIIPYPEELEEAVHRFNARLESGGKRQYALPERSSSKDHASEESPQLIRNYFLAVDEEEEVRGGYIIRQQPFARNGSPFPLSFLKLPVSEGAIDPRYATVGLEILMDSIDRNPLLFALGMGGIQQDLPRVLGHLGWEVVSVPFFFKIRNSTRVMQTLSVFQSSRHRRILSQLGSRSGLGRLATRILHPPSSPPQHARIHREKNFGTWADEVWEAAQYDYGLAAERSSKTLPEIYAPFEKNLQIFRFAESNLTLGWSACLVTQMDGHQYFGNLKVATMVDGFATGENIPEVIQGTIHQLEGADPDIIISNQLHHSWQEGLLQQGFREGPSNFALAISPACEDQLYAGKPDWHNFHINRGDGDGPIHL